MLVQAAGPGFRHGAVRIVITEPSGQHRTEAPAEQVHGKKVEGHGGATKAWGNDVVDGGVDAGIVKITEQAARSHQHSEEDELSLWHVESRVEEYCREKNGRGGKQKAATGADGSSAIGAPTAQQESRDADRAKGNGSKRIRALETERVIAAEIRGQ